MNYNTINFKISECKVPSVGIWWFYNDEVFYAATVPVEQGLRYGDCITGLHDHAETWDKLSKENKLLELPKSLRSEYFYIPRGRVVFHTDSKRFTILHGNLKKRQLERIRKYFCLTRKQTDYDTDFHYQEHKEDLFK